MPDFFPKSPPFFPLFNHFPTELVLKGRSRRRPKAHILDDPLGNRYDVLKVPLGSYKGPLWPYITQEKLCTYLTPERL